jgi:predicted TIM-barrel fold metal-dependent hydrolase
MNNAVIEMAQQCPNMALIGSSTTYKAILQAIKTLGASRVCFGTDAPFQWPHVIRAMYDSALDGEVTEKEKNLVMGGNIARILKLQATGVK